MKINGFKLVDFGRKGIKITTSENVVKDGITVVDDVDRHRPVPVPDKLRKKIQELKKQYMQICMYWLPEFDVLWDSDTCEVKERNDMKDAYTRLIHLLQCIQINGVKLVGSKFMIMGQVTVSENGQVSAITVPLLGPEDTEFYDETWSKIVEIKMEIKDYLESAKLEINAKQYLLPLYEKNQEDLDSMSDEEMEAQAMELLEGKGFVVISQSEVMDVEEAEKVIEESKNGKNGKKKELPAMSSDEKVRVPKIKDKFHNDSF
jgi:hypothetical protein